MKPPIGAEGNEGKQSDRDPTPMRSLSSSPSFALRSLSAWALLLAAGLTGAGSAVAANHPAETSRVAASAAVWSAAAVEQEYFVRVAPAARASSEFPGQFDTLKQSLSAFGANLDLILVGPTSLYVRFQLPAASVADRQSVLGQIQQLPLVAAVVAGQNAHLAMRDLGRLNRYSAYAVISDSQLRGMREKRVARLPDLTRPHAAEILVKYLQSAADTPSHLADAQRSLATLHRQLGTRLKRTLATEDTPIEVVTVPANRDFATALLAYQNSPVVEYAQPNYLVSLNDVPNDPAWNGVADSTTSMNMWNMARINAPTAWNITRNASHVVVAILDTGIDYNHTDLSQNLWPAAGAGAACGFNEVGGTDPLDDYSGVYHGTQVAGIIGAVGDNANGVTGVAWATQLMAVKVFDSTGACTDAGIIQGFSDAIAHGAQVVNCSFGMPANFDDFAFTSSFDALYQHDIVVVKAAGNNNSDHDGWSNLGNNDSYNLPNMLIVGASDNNDNRASFSDFGAYSVDLFAPGVNIWSTMPATTGGTTGFSYLQGCSVAAPHVAGVVALAKATFPWETAAELADRIRFSTDAGTGTAASCWTGGRLNAANALGARPRFSNLSTRCQINAGGSATAGFVISGPSAKQIVLRAQGPNLARYGVASPLADPQIQLYNSSGTLIDSNDNWGTLSAADQAVLSADGLTPGDGAESALVETLAPGSYTVVLSDTSPADSGVALIECFDIDGSSQNRLTNLSTLAYAGSGSAAMTAGFIVSGTQPRTVFIHGWGSSLAALGVKNTVSDTELTVADSHSNVWYNDNWTNLPPALQKRISLAPFATPGNATDSGIVLRLNPGAYTATLTGKGGATGVAMVEVDEF
jgi:hypothetical protein